MVPVPASALEQEMLSCCPSLFPLLCNSSNLTPFYPRTRVGRRHRKRAKAGMILFSKKFVIHLCLSLSLSLSLSIYLPIYIYLYHLSTYLPIYVHLSVCLSICLLSIYVLCNTWKMYRLEAEHTHTHTHKHCKIGPLLQFYKSFCELDHLTT
jgi:hypothetical protein